jgi:hypothetical protein
MNEEWLRAWARDHDVLVNVLIGTVFVLALVFRAIRWFRHNNLADAVGELVKPPPAAAESVVDAGQALSPRAMRVWSVVLAVLGVAAVVLTVIACRAEYDWLGAEVVRAPFVGMATAGGIVTKWYSVAATTRAPFIATFTSTPRRGGVKLVDDETSRYPLMVEVHRGEPLLYREHSRSTGRNLSGWPAIELYAALGALFGGLLLFFAFRLRA